MASLAESVSKGFVKVESPKPGQIEDYNHLQRPSVLYRMIETAKQVSFLIGGVFGVRRGQAPKQGSLAERVVQLANRVLPNLRDGMLRIAALAFQGLPLITAPKVAQFANFVLYPGKKLAIAAQAARLVLKVAKNGAKGAVQELTNEVVDHAGEKVKEVAVGILDRAAVKIGVTALIIGLVSGISLGAGTGLATKIIAAGAGAAGAGYLTNRVLKITGMKKNFIAGTASFVALAAGIGAFKLTEKLITLI